MSKRNVTYVSRELFLAIIEQTGLRSLRQAAFTKIFGSHGHYMYLPHTKTIGSISMAGFRIEPDSPLYIGVRELGGEKYGAVSQHLQHAERTEEEILETFRGLLAHMRDLPAQERKEARPPKEPKQPRKAKAVETEAPTTDESTEPDFVAAVESENARRQENGVTTLTEGWDEVLAQARAKLEAEETARQSRAGLRSLDDILAEVGAESTDTEIPVLA